MEEGARTIGNEDMMSVGEDKNRVAGNVEAISAREGETLEFCDHVDRNVEDFELHRLV
jgi:hypothetical protein